MEGPDEEITRRIADLSEHLLAEETLEVGLRRVADLAVRALPSCDGCGVSIVTPGGISTRVASDSMTQLVDTHQYEIGEGPCLDAVTTGKAVMVPHMTSVTRWPRFAARACEEGVVSSYSVPLKVRDETVGALNLYSRSGPFGPRDEAAVALFSSQAAVALANAATYQRVRDLVDQLSEALVTRDVIGQAKGIIMEREGRGAEEAFNILRARSQPRNVKLVDYARAVVSSAGRSDAAP